MKDEKVVRALTDLGNSERFLEKHCNDVKFCKQLKKWFIYNQGLWVMDANSILYEKAKITVEHSHQKPDWRTKNSKNQ